MLYAMCAASHSCISDRRETATYRHVFYEAREGGSIVPNFGKVIQGLT